MMFHDSMAVAQEKMTNVCLFLERHALPPSPLNYQVAYTYISQSKQDLNKAIDEAISQNANIDSVLIEQLYFEFLNEGHTTQVSMINNVNGVIDSLSRNAQSTEKQIVRFAGQVSECMHSLDENNVEQSRQALDELTGQTATLLEQHKQFKLELSRAKKLHEKTQKQLTQLRKQHIIDPQTGLYKRHYLTQQTQVWSTQEKSICAIAIQIDNLDHFVDNYGDVIGEVILSKVAKQVQKYVFQSGLPGRTAKDQFTVLLADIDPETANVIAEKVRNGVEKLRFVSSKSGIKLPGINLSLGIAQQIKNDNFNQLAKKASQAAFKARSLGQSSFTAGH
ncbi:GGDEF domain-containing protein [Pseudoalteromonas espejiana]|uniref:diguanylate cyclase n=2 Tax=Pseudoalteromonas espejiana TaxID=28107 RepID=A0A510XTS4_9GAMM|nr:GGDEF domain-containing protein [Pseudoalteromonas espejiana]